MPAKPPKAIEDLGVIKEIVTALVMAFAMAFVFRGFALEAFLIPTGSMAPTLLGAHVRVLSPTTGARWPVGPWEYDDRDSLMPRELQGSEITPLIVHDPTTGPPGHGLTLRLANQRTEAGDRIFVFKYLYSIFEPQRWDVVVFKYPEDPGENYIERLIGLPNEQVALVDGDVFTRPAGDQSWDSAGWRIRRKPERTQRALWQTVHDSRIWARYAGENTYNPWLPVGQGWTVSPGAYQFASASPATLRWDHDVWPITDFLGYNETSEDVALDSRILQFPVADLLASAVVKPQAGSLRAAVTISARGGEFRAEVDARGARVLMRTGDDWRTLDAIEKPGYITPGLLTAIEFWHVDQALWLFINGRLVAGGPTAGAYNWSPAQRIQAATGRDFDELLASLSNHINNPGFYWPSTLQWDFDGAPFTLSSLRVARDVYYRPDAYPPGHSQAGRPALATHPDSTPTLGPDQFLVCGDNSASSADSRLWDDAHPWVLDEFPHANRGLVPRELLIGKAFFVYFPSIQRHGRVPVVDFGRMRFIW